MGVMRQTLNADDIYVMSCANVGRYNKYLCGFVRLVPSFVSSLLWTTSSLGSGAFVVAPPSWSSEVRVGG